MHEPRSPTLIALDLDGTLEDSRADMVAAARRVRACFELPARADDALLPHVNGGMEQLYRACFDDYLANSDADAYERVRSAYEADYLAHVADQTRLYEGMADALAQLARLGALACVTNKPERISRQLLAALNVAQHFTTVVGGDTCAHSKPHPIMLQGAAERCGLSRAHRPAVMIGDTNADMQLARAFGARRVWCAWGYVATLTETCDAVAHQPADLPGLICS